MQHHAHFAQPHVAQTTISLHLAPLLLIRFAITVWKGKLLLVVATSHLAIAPEGIVTMQVSGVHHVPGTQAAHASQGGLLPVLQHATIVRQAQLLLEVVTPFVMLVPLVSTHITPFRLLMGAKIARLVSPLCLILIMDIRPNVI